MADPRRIRTRADWTRALQALFARSGLSYHVLAERCSTSTSTSTLQKMVTGQSFPRPSTVRLFVEACGELDSQPWVDARARIAAIDVTIKRPRTLPGRQIRIGVVPRAADSFQDREVAARLQEAAEQGGIVVLTQVLMGMGGVGKTQLAAAHARQAWRDGAGLLVWVNAASRDAIVSAYADAAQALALPGADREDPERSAQAFLAWAETVTGQWWLVVLDDVQEPADLNGLWPPAAESTAAGQVLVTTRLREAALAGEGCWTVEVSTFTLQEARAYLQANLGDRAYREQTDALAEALGLLPLALAQAAAYIRNADITIGRYLDLLATRLLHEVVPEPGHLTDDHQRIITATWELSIDQADRARPAGLARPLLQLASVLDAGGIPQAVMASPPALYYLTGHQPTPSKELTVAPEMVDEALRVLHRYSLIDHDRTATFREIRVHRLVQRATRENLAAGPSGADLYAALTYAAADALLSVWPPIERDQLGPILRANTTSMQQTAGSALWNADTGDRRALLFRAASSLGEAGQVAAAITAYTDLYSTAVQRLGPDHLDTLLARNNLVRWRAAAGDAAGATAAHEKLLTDYVRVLGPDHPDTLTIRYNLAVNRGQAGDIVGAAAAFEKLLAVRLRVLSPDHPDVLITRSAAAHFRGLTGDVAGTAAAFEGLLADRLRVLGPDHPDTLSTRQSLVRWRGQAGDVAGAAAAGQELLGDQLRVLGPDHPDTLSTRNNLAYWQGDAGDAAGAAAAFEGLLADELRVLGPDHPKTMITRNNLAYWRNQAGDAVGAITALEELLADYLRVLGPDHPNTMITRNNLAGWRGETGDGVGAVAAFEELLAARLRVLGPDHPDTMITRNNLAYWRRRAGLE